MDRSNWILCNRYNEETVISKSTFKAGRSNTLDIKCVSNKVSRDHALFIVYPNGTLHVQDNKSVNGTYINFRRIDPHRLHQLHVNDEVGLGLHSQLNIDALGPEHAVDLKYVFIVRKRLPNEVIVLDDTLESGSTTHSVVNAVTNSPLTRERLIDLLDSDDEVNINQNIELVANPKAEESISSNETRSTLPHCGDEPSTSASLLKRLENNPICTPQRNKRNEPLPSSSVNHLNSNPICALQRNKRDEPSTSASSVNHLICNPICVPQINERDEPSTSAFSVNHLESNCVLQKKERDEPTTSASSVNNLESNSTNHLEINPTRKPQKNERDESSTSASSVNHLESNPTRKSQRKVIEERSSSASSLNHLESDEMSTTSVNHLESNFMQKRQRKPRDERSTSASYSVNHLDSDPTHKPKKKERKEPSTSVNHLESNSTCKQQRKRDERSTSASSVNHLEINRTNKTQNERDEPSTTSSLVNYLESNPTRKSQRKAADKRSSSASSLKHLEHDSTRKPQKKERDETSTSSMNHLESSFMRKRQRKPRDEQSTSASYSVNHLDSDPTRKPQKKGRDEPSTSASSVNHLENNSTRKQQRKVRDEVSTSASSVNHLENDPTHKPQKKGRDEASTSVSSLNHIESNPTRKPQKNERDEPSTSAYSVKHLESDLMCKPQKKGREEPPTSASSLNHLVSNPIRKPQKEERGEPSISASPLNDLQSNLRCRTQDKEKDEPSISASSVNHVESNPRCEPDQKGSEEAENIIKQEPPDNFNNHNVDDYTIEDGCIVIDDDDDEFPCSQLLIDEPSPNVDQDFLSESIFFSIKKELEELDRLEDGRVYPCVDLVDSDGEDSEDWVTDSKNESRKEDEENENYQVVSEPNIQKEDNNEAETLPTKLHGSSKVKYVKPPVIAPHVEIKTKTNRKSERISETKTPEKRKRVEKENEEAKKIKTSTFYTTKSKDDAGWKRKRKQEATKETKEQLHEIRKKKLKEIAEKRSEEKETKTTKCKTATAKVKVSDSRGMFLTENIDMPSTSRTAHTSINGSLRPRNTSIDPRKCVTSNSCISNKPLTNQYNNMVCNNNYIRRPKSTHFVSKSVIPVLAGARTGIPKNCENIDDILIRFLNWKTAWFQKWKDYKVPPPIHNKPLNRVSQSFSSYSDYYNTVVPLFELELWNYVVKGINEESEPRKKKFIAQIEKETKMESYAELQCFTYITKQQHDTASHLKEEDAVMVQFVFRQHADRSITIPMLGYVTEVYKKVLQDRDFIDADFGKELGIEPNAVITFKMLVQAFKGTIDLERYMHIKIVASLVPTTRIIRSVKYLEHSSLCQHVLKPTFPLYNIPHVRQERLFSRDELNAVQYQAVMEATETCLRRDPGIYLIQGPPGTGKTTVIINIIQQILFRELNTRSSKQYCILVVAPSNAAVDELTLRLIKLKPKLEAGERKEIKLVRLGPKNVISSAVQDYTLYELTRKNVIDTFLSPERNSMVPRNLFNLQQQIVNMKENSNSPGVDVRLNAAKEELERGCRRIMGRTWHETFRKTEETLLEKARIICTTLSSCVGMRMQGVFGGPSKLQCCIVDEATQTSEQETLIPLMLGIDRMVLVGDPKQLSGVTLSKEAKDCAYGQSLFTRVTSFFEGKAKNPIRMLDTQYRMHPAICHFPSKMYYNGTLKTAPVLKTRSSSLNILKPYLVFNFKMDHFNSQEYLNKAEIDCVIKLLDAIVMNIKDSCAYSVGIVTPYNSQKEGIIAVINSKKMRPNVSIAVNTVDSFQGQEKDIIIMSCVRDYSNNFVSDEQRLNVAMTRAMHALYIIGSDSLLKTCASLGKVYDDAKRRVLIQVVNYRTSVTNLSDMIKIKT